MSESRAARLAAREALRDDEGESGSASGSATPTRGSSSKRKRSRSRSASRSRKSAEDDGGPSAKRPRRESSKSRSPSPPRTSTTTESASRSKGKKSASSQRDPLRTGFKHAEYSAMIKEDHGEALYSVAFNTVDPALANMCATCGSNRVSVYECADSGALVPMQAYVDENPDEIYYFCCWTFDSHTGAPLLCVAGLLGMIKSLVGHGAAINYLAVHPQDENLIFSASKDYSIRLWNIRTSRCVAIFAGEGGHRNEVLSVEVHVSGTKMVTAGMDRTIKVWQLDSEPLQQKVKESYNAKREVGARPWRAQFEHFPTFSTNKVHRNYVDDAKWLGNTILSKSVENRLVRWRPGSTLESDGLEALSGSNFRVVAEYPLNHAEIWFLRFDLDATRRFAAVGNIVGVVYIFDLDAATQSEALVKQLSHAKCTTTVRRTAISADGSIVLAACDNGTLWRYNRK